jgi:exopolysaccharide biosynthesis protein
MFVFDANNKFYYFKDSREFKSAADFEKNYGVKIQAAIGNKPRLIQDYMNYLIEWEMDKKQLETKAVRNAIGYLNNKLYLIAAYNATVPELADIMKTFGVEYALNLDGGYSNAVWYNDEYMAGPGRDIPNAILFSQF